MIIDEIGNPIEKPNLEDGYLVSSKIAKPNAYDTIDNITKFALYDDDYIDVQMYIPINPIDKLQTELKKLETEYAKTNNELLIRLESLLTSDDTITKPTKTSRVTFNAQSTNVTNELINKRKKLRQQLQEIHLRIEGLSK